MSRTRRTTRAATDLCIGVFREGDWLRCMYCTLELSLMSVLLRPVEHGTEWKEKVAFDANARRKEGCLHRNSVLETNGCT